MQYYSANSQVLILEKILWYEYYQITYFLPIFNGESLKLYSNELNIKT